jgi:hypothetical protein
MDLADQTETKRQLLKSLQPVLQRPHVIVHFAYIRRRLKQGKLHSFEGVKVREGCPGAFYAGRQHSLAPNKGANQQMGIGQGTA